MKQRFANAHNLQKDKKKKSISHAKDEFEFLKTLYIFIENDLFSRTISRAIDFDYAICRYHEKSIFDFVSDLLSTHQNNFIVEL